MTTSDARRLAADGRHNAEETVDRAVEGISATSRDLAARAADIGQQAFTGLRAGAEVAADRLPVLVEEGAAASADAFQTIREMPDDRMALVAAFSAGLGVGLWLAGAPRLVTLAAFSPAIIMGLASASRAGSLGGTKRAARRN